MALKYRSRRPLAALLSIFALGSILFMPGTGLGAPRTVVGELWSADG